MHIYGITVEYNFLNIGDIIQIPNSFAVINPDYECIQDLRETSAF